MTAGSATRTTRSRHRARPRPVPFDAAACGDGVMDWADVLAHARHETKGA